MSSLPQPRSKVSLHLECQAWSSNLYYNSSLAFQVSTNPNFPFQSIVKAFSTEWSTLKCRTFRFVRKIFLQFFNRILLRLYRQLLRLTNVEIQRQNRNKSFTFPLLQASPSSDKMSTDNFISRL